MSVKQTPSAYVIKISPAQAPVHPKWTCISVSLTCSPVFHLPDWLNMWNHLIPQPSFFSTVIVKLLLFPPVLCDFVYRTQYGLRMLKHGIAETHVRNSIYLLKWTTPIITISKCYHTSTLLRPAANLVWLVSSRCISDLFTHRPFKVKNI